jgi:hypothetical protein
MIKKNNLKTRTKLKHTNITKLKNKKIKIKPKQIDDKNNKNHYITEMVYRKIIRFQLVCIMSY